MNKSLGRKDLLKESDSDFEFVPYKTRWNTRKPEFKPMLPNKKKSYKHFEEENFISFNMFALLENESILIIEASEENDSTDHLTRELVRKRKKR